MNQKLNFRYFDGKLLLLKQMVSFFIEVNVILMLQLAKHEDFLYYEFLESDRMLPFYRYIKIISSDSHGGAHTRVQFKYARGLLVQVPATERAAYHRVPPGVLPTSGT